MIKTNKTIQCNIYRYNKLLIIDNSFYIDENDKHKHLMVKCKCDCGNITYIRYDSITREYTKTCNHCYDNKYLYINDIISILKIFDFKNQIWVDILINTECVYFFKNNFIKWRLHKDGFSHIVVLGNFSGKTSVSLHRLTISYINSKYNLPPLTDDLVVDHISGNTFNNLYYPFNDYYNNLRVCTDRQNCLNTKTKGYFYSPSSSKINPYIANFMVNGKRIHKSFHTPQECINYNISQLSDIDKQYYYHSPSNPRNNPNTFSNTILNAIGYNDNEYEYTDDDFNDEEFEKYI